MTSDETVPSPRSHSIDGSVVSGGTSSVSNAARSNASEEQAGYDLADPDPAPPPPKAAPVEEPIPLPVAEPEPEVEASTFQASSDEPAGQRPVEFPDERPEVREIWSRWVDWKEPLIWSSAAVVLATLIVFAHEYVAIALFLAGIAYGAYCVVISLEVPVRVTPEQAIDEFFAAACHRMPNYRRMYGLLTADGRRCDSFSNFAEFRSYWTSTIGRWANSPIWLVPLEFQLEGFKHRYNPDKSMATVSYTVKVIPRGRAESAKPLVEFPASNLVVKGTDGQWYVNDGTVPG